MATDPETFNRHLSQWKEHQDTPWGRLRYRLVERNLRAHLPSGNHLRALDAGGGNGGDSLPLARSGVNVTLLDYSAKMLEDARTNAGSEGVLSRIEFRQAAVGEIPTILVPSSYDVVLLHNVLAYVEDPEETLRAAVHPLRGGGLLSVMEVNRYSEPMNAAVRSMDLDDALAKLDAVVTTAWTFGGTPVRRYTAEELASLILSQGFELVEQYGVMCITGYIWDNDVKYDPEFFSKLEALEISMSTRFPYCLLARFSHLIAVRK